jgi:hypothetical protein
MPYNRLMMCGARSRLAATVKGEQADDDQIPPGLGLSLGLRWMIGQLSYSPQAPSTASDAS